MVLTGATATAKRRRLEVTPNKRGDDALPVDLAHAVVAVVDEVEIPLRVKDIAPG